MIDPGHPRLSIVRQCELASISRSSFYREPTAETEATLQLMRLIDEQFLETPWADGTASAPQWLVRRTPSRPSADEQDGVGADLPAAEDERTASAASDMAVSVRHLTIDRPNQVWCADVTYIPMRRGFLYLVVIMDWFSRKVLAWRLSNTMDADFCVTALEEAIARFGYCAWGRAPAVEEARNRRERIAETAASMAGGSEESRTQDRAHCGGLRGRP